MEENRLPARRPMPPAMIMFKPARWLFGAVWVARNWRAVWVGIHLAIVALGVGLIALSRSLGPDDGSSVLLFVGILLGAWGVLRLPRAAAVYRRGRVPRTPARF